MRRRTLERYAERRHIPIYYLPSPHCGSMAVDCGRDKSAVILDNSRRVTEAEATTRLAHELGHCCTGSFYSIYAAVDSIERHEARAWNWAIKSVLPIEHLREAARQGITERWALAEHFGVTEEFVDRAMKYYDARGVALTNQDEGIEYEA